MTNDTTPSQPPDERFTELSRHVQARDIAWLRERHGSGDLAWLAPHLGPSVYRDLGQAVDVGDIDLVRRHLAAMGDHTTLLGEPVAQVTTSGSGVTTAAQLSGVTGDPLTTDIDDPTLLVSRRGAVLPASAVRRERNTLVVLGIVLALIAAGIVAFLLLRDSDKSSDSTVVASDSSIAAETVATDTAVDTIVETTVPPSSPVSAISTDGTATPAAAVPPPSAAGTVKPAASPSNVPAPPRANTPLADAITTAGRSSTFGPYLAMVDAAGLTNELRAMKNVTILAPTESAFSTLSSDVQVALRSPSNRDVLARIVRYSVLMQSRTASQMTPGNYTTAEGSPVNIQAVNNTIRVNDATITGPDVKVANGVLHAIDRLLVPPTLDLNSLLPRSGTAATAPGATAVTAPATSPPAAPTTAPATVAPATTTPAAVVTPTTVATSSPATTSPATTSSATTSAPATTVTPTTRAPSTTTT